MWFLTLGWPGISQRWEVCNSRAASMGFRNQQKRLHQIAKRHISQRLSKQVTTCLCCCYLNMLLRSAPLRSAQISKQSQCNMVKQAWQSTTISKNLQHQARQCLITSSSLLRCTAWHLCFGVFSGTDTHQRPNTYSSKQRLLNELGSWKYSHTIGLCRLD